MTTETTDFELGLSRLKATLEKLKTLDEKSFDYAGFVQEFDNQKMCPTVGCVAGYLPLWFDDTPFRYLNISEKADYKVFVLSHNSLVSSIDIEYGLVQYYGCPSKIIRCLFFGDDLRYHFSMLNLDNTPLKDVVHRFEEVIKLTENGTLSWN